MNTYSSLQAMPAAWRYLHRKQRTHALLVVLLPLSGTAAALWLAFTYGVSPGAIAMLVIGHALSMTGICVGFHRLFTHRSFVAPQWLRALLCGLGATAGEGPVIFWVSTHRQHHQFSDLSGDPHSPHVPHGEESAWRGFWHAHFGWMFSTLPADPVKYAPDLLRDPAMQKWNRQYWLWLIGSWLLPGVVLLAIDHHAYALLEGILWGGMVRTLVVQHATWSVNSFCHMFGRVPHATREYSKNNGWLCYLTWGESWHNNHHAMPRSAYHGMRWWQLDPAGYQIRLLNWLGVIRDVHLPASTGE